MSDQREHPLHLATIGSGELCAANGQSNCHRYSREQANVHDLTRIGIVRSGFTRVRSACQPVPKRAGHTVAQYVAPGPGSGSFVRSVDQAFRSYRVGASPGLRTAAARIGQRHSERCSDGALSLEQHGLGYTRADRVLQYHLLQHSATMAKVAARLWQQFIVCDDRKAQNGRFRESERSQRACGSDAPRWPEHQLRELQKDVWVG